MPADRTLELGVLFTARANSSFTQNLRRLRSALMDLNNLMGNVTSTTKEAAAATRSITKEFTKATNAMEKVSKAASSQNKQVKALTGAWGRLVGAMKVTASYTIAAAIIYGITSSLKAGIQEIIEYDQALKNLLAISGATEAELRVMRDTLEQIATSTKFSTTELAKGMVLLTQSGFSAAEAVNSIQAVADLATGTLSSMATTTDLVTTTIRAFGLHSIEASRVADVMANAVNKSKLTIDKLRIAFNYVGATAAQANISLEETAAAMMTLANNGLRASTIGTGLRQVISRLLAPSSKLREAFEEYGIELDKVSPDTQGLTKALKNLVTILMDADGTSVDMA